MARNCTDSAVSDEQRAVRRVTLCGMVVNVALSALKAVVGWFAGSQALLADSVHSVSDLATDFAVLFGVRYWTAPADDEHPYGHGKIQAVVAASIGLALAVVALGIGRTAVLRLCDVVGGGTLSAPGSLAFWIAILSIVSKEAIYRKTLAVAKRFRSSALEANAWHHRSDAISSIPVALALAVSYFAPSLAWTDSVGALVVSLFILGAAWEILRPAVEELTDAEMPGKSAEVARIALSVKGVKGCHRVRTRRYGGVFQADLHIQVDRDRTVCEGHAIGHEVCDAVRTAGIGVVDAVVHVEPVSSPATCVAGKSGLVASVFCVMAASCAFAELLPVEIYEKGGGDIDRSARYSIAEVVRETGVATGDFKLCSRLVKVTNPSNETRTFQAVVRAASDFKPTNWVIPGVIYGDNSFGNQISPSGLERDGEPWVFGYDRASIPSCTLSENKDSLFAMFASDRDRASLESSCSLKRLADGRLEHRIFYPIRESPVCYAFKFKYVDRYDEWITLPPGATFEAESYFMTGKPRWENCGYREVLKAAMSALKHDHPIPVMDADAVEKVSHQWILDCCEKSVADGKSKGAMGTDISFRLGYTARTNKVNLPAWMTEAEKKLTLADLERDPSLNRHYLRTFWMDEMGFAGQNFMTHRFAYKGAVKRGDAEFAKWCLDDLDDWAKRQVASGLAPTRRRRKIDSLSVTELGWGVGEMAKMWKMLKDDGIDHPLYLDFARRLADFFVEHYDERDPFGRLWSLKTGEKVEGGGDGGGFMAKGMLELHAVCGDRRYLDCARKAFDRYFEMDIGKFRCVAGADDCNCVDKESSFPYLYAALELYRQTGEKKYLDCAERVAAYFCSWMFTYDALYPPTSEFGRFGYHTSGGTLVSAEHPAIDPYATVAIPDLFDLADATGERVWRDAGRLIWVNAVQDIAGPGVGSLNGVLRTPGSQCEAHSQTRWAKYRSDPIAARGNFNNQCTAFIVTYRLYALERVGDPMKGASDSVVPAVR